RGRRQSRERGRLLAHLAARARDLDRDRGAAVGFGGADLGGGAKAPGAVHEHAHPEAHRARVRDRGHAAVFHLDELHALFVDARVGVRRAAGAGRIQSAAGDVLHDASLWSGTALGTPQWVREPGGKEGEPRNPDAPPLVPSSAKRGTYPPLPTRVATCESASL